MATDYYSEYMRQRKANKHGRTCKTSAARRAQHLQEVAAWMVAQQARIVNSFAVRDAARWEQATEDSARTLRRDADLEVRGSGAHAPGPKRRHS